MAKNYTGLISLSKRGRWWCSQKTKKFGNVQKCLHLVLHPKPNEKLDLEILAPPYLNFYSSHRSDGDYINHLLIGKKPESLGMSRAPKVFILTLDIPNDGGYANYVLLHLSSYRSEKEHLFFCHVNTFERYQTVNRHTGFALLFRPGSYGPSKQSFTAFFILSISSACKSKFLFFSIPSFSVITR